MPRSKPPLAVWTATALHLGAMVIFTLIYPAYWGFDETGHVSRVLSSQNGDLYPTPGTEPYVVGVNDSYQMFDLKDQPPFITYIPLPRADRPSFISLGGATEEPKPTTVPNQLAQHPPGYYALAAGVLDAVPGSANLSWDQTVGLLRLLDVAVHVAAAVSVLGDRAALHPKRRRGSGGVRSAAAPGLRAPRWIGQQRRLVDPAHQHLLVAGDEGDGRRHPDPRRPDDGHQHDPCLAHQGICTRLATGRRAGLSRRVASQPHRRSRTGRFASSCWPVRSAACGGFATSTSTAVFNRPGSPLRRRTRCGRRCRPARRCTSRRSRTTCSIA